MASGVRYSPRWRGRYPHLREVDMPVWNAFLDRYGEEWQAFEYDVRVGPPGGGAAAFDEQTRAVFEDLSRLRIDAVGYRPGEVWVLEVSPYAGISKVGQCLGYRDLLVKDRLLEVLPRMGVVTRVFPPGVGEVFKSQGIEVWLV